MPLIIGFFFRYSHIDDDEIFSSGLEPLQKLIGGYQVTIIGNSSQKGVGGLLDGWAFAGMGRKGKRKSSEGDNETELVYGKFLSRWLSCRFRDETMQPSGSGYFENGHAGLLAVMRKTGYCLVSGAAPLTITSAVMSRHSINPTFVRSDVINSLSKP